MNKYLETENWESFTVGLCGKKKFKFYRKSMIEDLFFVWNDEGQIKLVRANDVVFLNLIN